MITCKRCKREIGAVLDIGGLELLQLAGLVCIEVKARCIHCGEEFYYSVTLKQVQKIVMQLPPAYTERTTMIRQLRAEGKTWMEIAQLVGCSVLTCKRVIK